MVNNQTEEPAAPPPPDTENPKHEETPGPLIRSAARSPTIPAGIDMDTSPVAYRRAPQDSQVTPSMSRAGTREVVEIWEEFRRWHPEQIPGRHERRVEHETHSSGSGLCARVQ